MKVNLIVFVFLLIQCAFSGKGKVSCFILQQVIVSECVLLVTMVGTIVGIIKKQIFFTALSAKISS